MLTTVVAVMFTAGVSVMLTTVVAVAFTAGVPVMLTTVVAVVFTMGAVTGAVVSITGTAVVLVAAAAVVVVVVGDGEPVHPAIMTMLMTKIAIASAIPRFRFILEVLVEDLEIELICAHLWFKKAVSIFSIDRRINEPLKYSLHNIIITFQFDLPICLHADTLTR